MKFDREELLKALGRVKPAIRSGGIVPALTHVWFDADTLRAYDGGFGVKLLFESALTCGAPGLPLINLLNTSALADVELEPKDKNIAVKFGKSTTKLNVLGDDATPWPFPAKLPKGSKPTELDEEFIEALRKVLFIRVQRPERTEHYGVTVTKTKNDLALFTTDSARMASMLLKGAGKEATFEKVILPREFAEQIVSQCPAGVSLYVLDDCLVAEGEDVTFYSNLLSVDTLDDMGAILARKKAQHPKPVAVPAGIAGALARAEVLAGAEEPAVKLSAADEALTVSGHYALGDLDEELELEGVMAEAELTVKASHLRQALPYAEKLSITDDTLMLFGDDGFSYLVAQWKV